MTIATTNGYTAGIPSQEEDPWTEHVEAGRPVDETIAAQAVSRLFGPHDKIHDQLYRLLAERIDQGLDGPARDQARDAIRALDALRWSELRLAIEITVRVMRHLPAPAMGMEAMLQTALANAGLGTVAEANALTRQVYAGGTRSALQRIWKDFEPEALTIIPDPDDRYGIARALIDNVPRPISVEAPNSALD